MTSLRSNAATLPDEGSDVQSPSERSERLAESEKEVYEFIRGRGEMLASTVSARMGGAIPDLERKGVIEVFKKSSSRSSPNKGKFVRITAVS